jgi:hypothetical protein
MGIERLVVGGLETMDSPPDSVPRPPLPGPRWSYATTPNRSGRPLRTPQRFPSRRAAPIRRPSPTHDAVGG